MRADLATAIASVERRFGTHVLAHGAAIEQRARERRVETATSLDKLTPALATGLPLAFVGPGSSGKVTLAYRAAAGAQRDGGTVLWIDPSASFDPLAARAAGVELERALVVRARSRDDVLLAAHAGLRSDGFRLIVVDTGSAIAPGLPIDDLAPILPVVRASPAALLVVSDVPAAHLAIPTLRVERVAWKRRFERTTGWTALAGDRALFHFGALGRELCDIGAGAAQLEAVS